MSEIKEETAREHCERIYPEMMAEFKKIQAEMYAMFAAKHMDYGLNNIALGGDIVNNSDDKQFSLTGLCIRLTDKISRLKKSIPETQLLYQLIVSGVILLPISFLFNDYIRDINLNLILIFVFQVIVIMCLGFIGWLWVMSKYSASGTNSFMFLTPIFGVLFGWLIMDDNINLQIYLSLFLTLGIYLITDPLNGPVNCCCLRPSNKFDNYRNIQPTYENFLDLIQADANLYTYPTLVSELPEKELINLWTKYMS
mgnify:CR=1 FL=1